MKNAIRLTVQVLNGATGEIREITANVKAVSDQDAVNKVMATGRTDDYYYRFLCGDAVTPPTIKTTAVEYQGMTYWARE